MYTTLNIKTEYSLLKSMIKVKDLVKFAKKNNIKALTITDDNMFGVMEFYKECNKNDIKPIIGLDISKFNRILYAKNEKGYKNLLKITTKLRDLTLTEDFLKEYSSNLICIIPFSEKDNIQKYSYYEDVFVSFKNQEEESKLDTNKIYMDEVLYLNKDDYKYLNYLDAIRTGEELTERKKQDNYFKLEKELDFDLTNNYKILDLCDIKINPSKDLLPKYDCPNNMDSYSYLKQLSIKGLKKRFGSSVNIKYQERLKHELEVIHKMGFDDYFLIVYDYVNFARVNGILVGPGRGSAAGSLVSYLLGITNIDPIKYDLLFERFLNENRVTLPDIDIDFDGFRKKEVIDYCISKFGEKRVSGIITFVTLGAKQVLKDVGRVMEETDDVDFLCRMIDSKKTLKENYETLPKIKRELESNKKLQEIFEIALHLEGLKKTTSVHASGIVMCNDDIDTYVPLEKHDDMYLTGYDMNYLEELGLIKMDFLSLKTLTIMNNILEDIDEKIDINNVALDDEATINLFKQANTLGIFQFESSGMIELLKKFKLNNFEDIFNIMALYRPGPMKNIDSFIRRRNKKEKVDFFTPDLVPILKSTYGIIVYQEQIMQIAATLADYSLGEADILRRAMSKKKENILIEEKDKFIQRSIKKGYDQKLANHIYDLILKFAEYGFNKSHSVAYTYISYQMAYLKAHYPNQYMKNLLNYVNGSEKVTKEYINECKNIGIRILNPDINKSINEYDICEEGIIYPLNGIKNLGINTISNIIEERKNGEFKDIEDFLTRVDKKIVNEKSIRSLINSGCFDNFELNRRTLNENLDIILNYSELVNDLGKENTLKPEIIIYEEYSKKQLIQNEYECFGFYLNNNPISDYRKKYNKLTSINNVSSYYNKFIDIIAFVDSVKDFTNNKNERMCFLKISDSYSILNVVVFSKTYLESPKLEMGNIVEIIGRVEMRNGIYQIVANKIVLIEDNKN